VVYLSSVDFPQVSSRKKDDTIASISAHPVVVDFDKLLRSGTAKENIFPNIPNIDLLHAVASLYNVALSEVTDDVIYPTIFETWSRTILLVRSVKQSEQSLYQNLLDSCNEPAKPEPLKEICKKVLNSSNTNGPQGDLSNQSNVTDPLKENDDVNPYSLVFSDDDESVNNDEEEGPDAVERFMVTFTDFLGSVKERKKRKNDIKNRLLENDNSTIEKEMLQRSIGIEDRLIGALTYERSYEKPGCKLLHLTLMAVRKKYQKYGCGSYMVKQLMNNSITEGSDAIIVNADTNAVEFFEKQGFSDDAILNSQFSHIGDCWFNSKRMCHISNFNGHYTQGADIRCDPLVLPDLQMRQMDLDLALWKEKSLQAYQTQAVLVDRMRHEILTLRAKLSVKDDQIAFLQEEIELLKEKIVDKSENDLRLRIETLKTSVTQFNSATFWEDCPSSSSSAECPLLPGTPSAGDTDYESKPIEPLSHALANIVIGDDAETSDS